MSVACVVTFTCATTAGAWKERMYAEMRILGTKTTTTCFAAVFPHVSSGSDEDSTGSSELEW